jgi:predicted transcriptional regulator
VKVTTMTPPQSNVEDVICSRIRLRILKLLMQSEQLNVSAIARRVGGNYASASMHIKVLEDEHILTHVTFGKRIRFYRFAESARGQAVKRLIKAWLP